MAGRTVRKARLLWKLFATYLGVIVLCTVAVGFFAVHSARDFYITHTESELADRARLVEAELGDFSTWGRGAPLEALVRRWGLAAHTRITLIARDGTVLAESERSPQGMQNHATRPEVLRALAGGVGADVRHSVTLNENLLYVALPVVQAASVQAVIRVALPLTAINAAVSSLSWRIIDSAIVVAVLSALIGLYTARRISGQMRAIKTGAERIAGGDFSSTLEVPSTQEFAVVAESLNRMAVDLNETIGTITRERNERQAVLSSMVEGVLAVDRDERVIAANEALANLLGITAGEAEGRTIQEVVRNTELQRFVSTALASQAPVEGEITLRAGHEERTLQANGTLLRGAHGGIRGAVVVLNDITRLKRLEAVRRDFVANVSHELKTPVTSIKGFAETLRDGALEDPAAAARFVRIIAGQADRLNAIIADLLALSSIELADERGVPLSEASINDVLQVAVEVCEPKAAAKGITLRLTLHEELLTNMNPPLLEQAVVNLIDNAVKYSPGGSSVEVMAQIKGAEVVISVTDEGPGVPREHLPRLFERFYRIDKARSRDLGGTGLGLAIVKHIAQAHGGRAGVTSTLGSGSTFFIALPLA